MEITCKICSGPLSLYIQDIYDDRYGYPDIFKIYTCPNCSSFITLPALEMDKIEALYTNFYPRKNIQTDGVKNRFERWRLENSSFGGLRACKRWLAGEHRVHRTLPPATHPGIKILDIGCGDGSSLLELQSLGYEAYGIETDNNLERIKNDLGLHIFIGTVENAPFAPHSFNYIIANQVLEHVVELDTFMEGIKKFLAPGGIVILSTPNANSIFRKMYGKKWIHWHIPYHQQILGKKAARILLEKHGFLIQHIETTSPSSWTIHEINRTRFTAMPGLKNPFWVASETIKSSFAGKVSRRIIFILMSSLGKIANLFGQGNCLIVYATRK